MKGREALLQGKIIRWLKEQGAYVVKAPASPGVPVGCPDILAFFEEKWLAIEVKASRDSKFQPGQAATIMFLSRGNRFVFVVYPEVWPRVQEVLTDDFFV